MTLQLMPLTDENLQTARRPSPGMPEFETAVPVPAFVAERAAQMLQAGVAAAWARPFYILRPGDLLAVGSCGFKQAPQHRRVEIGYAVLAAHQGQGFATAAVAALLRLAFLSVEADEVLAQINPENIASVCVVQKLGFERGACLIDEDGEPLVQWLATVSGYK